MKLEDGFHYKKNELHCEDVSLKSIGENFGTPTYVYSKSALLKRARRLKSSLPKNCQIYFSVKSCSNIHILKVLAKENCGGDIVSGGELFRSFLAGFQPNNIVFSGVGKSVEEITEAIAAKIFLFNVESLNELLLINFVSKKFSVKSKVSFRINPNVRAKTHPYISTGLKKNKFGLSSSELQEALTLLPDLSNVKLIGLSCHIGSQIQAAKPLLEAWKYLLSHADRLRMLGFSIEHLDLGGGLGISYGKAEKLSIEEYGAHIARLFKGKPYHLGIEPGRSLIGPTAVLLTTLLHPKIRDKRNFYVLDAAMNDLIRPALYGSLHPFVPVELTRAKEVQATLVGPICESGDTFQENARVPLANSGDLFAFLSTGAYGMSMASQYNSRPKAAEVLVDGKKMILIREREDYSDLVRREVF